MAFIDYKTQTINCKIVYYGPGLAGKTTNIDYIHDNTVASNKGKITHLATETERVLFFDFLPDKAKKVRKFDVRFHLYTVPG